MATEDILVWDGTEFVSIQGKPGQSPTVDPNCDVSEAACDGNAAATVAVTYKDANGDTTADETEAVSTNLKFGFTLVPGCDGKAGTTVTEDTGNHTASKLLPNQQPTVTITDAVPGDADELKLNFAFGLPQGERGSDGTSINIIGTIGTEGGDSGQGLTDLNTAYPDAEVGDVVVDSAGEGWLSDGASGWTSIGQFRGPDGKEAVLNAPTVSNVPCAGGNPGTATATIVKNELQSNETSNVYDVTFGIPEGCAGSDGTDGKNAQVIKQASEPSVDGEGDPVRMGCIWIRTTV